MICAGVLIVNFYLQAKNQLRMAKLQEKAHPEEIVVEEDTVEIPIDFDEIRKENKDIVAWIQIPDTKVDYPVLQSAPDMEEDFYLNHNLDGSEGYPGCIYMQRVNTADFSDSVTVVYGHNMKNGTMFKGLHEYKDLEYLKEHDTFYVYTPTEIKTYRVIAATTYDNRLIPAYFNDFSSETDVQNFLDELFSTKESAKNHFIDVEDYDASNHYVVLSTCTSSDTVRWLVVGVQE